MSSAVGARTDASGRKKLDSLRPRFEKLGYTFEVQPQPATLPAFMAGWRPDAVATRGDDNIAIEVKQSTEEQSERLTALRSRFANQTNWRLAVVTGGVDPESLIAVSASDVESIGRAEQEVEQLVAQGHTAAALVMAFALLEATCRIARDDGDQAPKQAGSVIQALAIDGLLEPLDEHRLRLLVEPRNRVVHGELQVEVAPEDVCAVLTIIRKVLTAAFAE